MQSLVKLGGTPPEPGDRYNLALLYLRHNTGAVAANKWKNWRTPSGPKSSICKPM